jgi:hypothetical protein
VLLEQHAGVRDEHVDPAEKSARPAASHNSRSMPRRSRQRSRFGTTSRSTNVRTDSRKRSCSSSKSARRMVVAPTFRGTRETTWCPLGRSTAATGSPPECPSCGPRIKAQLGPQPADELDTDLVPVQVAIKVERMGQMAYRRSEKEALQVLTLWCKAR